MERSETIKVGIIAVALVGAGVLAIGSLTGDPDVPDDAPKVETSYWTCTACDQQYEMTPDELAEAEDSAKTETIESTGAIRTRFQAARRLYPCRSCGEIKAMQCLKCQLHGEIYPAVQPDGKPGACSQCQPR